MELVRLYLSGNVRRWHHNPAMAGTGQTDADHHGRCVQLLLALHPAPSIGLVRYVALHDVGELDAGDLDAGDLSYDFKRTNPDIAAAHADFEDMRRQQICGPDPALSIDELRWVKFIDRLESACWCLMTCPQEYMRPASGWLNAEAFLLVLADDLSCGLAVRGLLHDLKGGLW